MEAGSDESDPAAARDMAALYAGREEEIDRPDDSQWPVWSGYVQAAWHELRDDRFYGAMGGMGRIYFAAIDIYAARYNIDGSAFDDFVTFIRALDDEYIAHETKKQKAEQAKNKTP